MQLREIDSEEQLRKLMAENPDCCVKVWGINCKPCVHMASYLKDDPVVQKSQLPLFSVEVSKVPDLAAEHRIKIVPTLLFFRKGHDVHIVVGREFDKIQAALDAYEVPAGH